MKPIAIYKPVTVEQAIQILSLHGTEGVYAGGTGAPGFGVGQTVRLNRGP